MIDFKNIDYLKTGNKRQKIAYLLLNELAIFDYLKKYNPILTGTIPIEIDVPDSDLDIICECKDHTAYAKDLTDKFGKYLDFQIWTNTHYGVKSTIASFSYKSQKIEIFGQNIPTEKQNSFRHMLIERQILQEKGSEFKNQIIELKKQGIKTEHAFAQLLGLKGDPYLELLKYDTDSYDISVRQANESDVGDLTQLFYDTIQNINIRDYSQEEVDDWSSWKADIDKWLVKMQEQYFVVAEKENKIVGFSSLALDGYLDFMFVDKDTQGKGVASALLSEIERKAIEQYNDIIYSDVSLTAKRFFENKGYIVEKQQLKKSKTKELINFRMTKKINSTR
ncbi:GNAT family N-acetyltransferase [Perlabentimonas gracilis]|uniref:GNAT family N-acetyltransferase n=1 Tax=Perlabentimonas gracilis TaxID=2715279 RepID=UPI00140C2B3A|nr:GNAT family N-acetyltransferase [Perlabentimonas gracilis]NHB69811.1 GNAT family N-acetyltransferase [Perlabentimonas gracilis]